MKRPKGSALEQDERSRELRACCSAENGGRTVEAPARFRRAPRTRPDEQIPPGLEESEALD